MIENAGFNTQKNDGYELGHVYGQDEDLLQCFYLLLQIVHLILQLVEQGSLLRRVARQYGKSVVGLYGSVRNIAWVCWSACGIVRSRWKPSTARCVSKSAWILRERSSLAVAISNGCDLLFFWDNR
jgi:hypothetical protein